MVVTKQLKKCLDITYQLKILEEINTEVCQVNFSPSQNIPSVEAIKSIIDQLDFFINSKNGNLNKELLIELQVLLICSLVLGISPSRLTKMCKEDWLNFHHSNYQNTTLQIVSRNNYVDGLVRNMYIDSDSLGSEKMFKWISEAYIYDTINMLFILNGLEVTMNEELLRICFGRYHYINSGRIREVREFLKRYFNAEDHMTLLVKLKLVESVYYSTMLRN